MRSTQMQKGEHIDPFLKLHKDYDPPSLNEYPDCENSETPNPTATID